jgi:cobalamin biosynthesis Mg chelatase CobN
MESYGVDFLTPSFVIYLRKYYHHHHHHRPYSRLFSNPPGDFGSMVNEQIGSGDWNDGKELGKKNIYIYIYASI